MIFTIPKNKRTVGKKVTANTGALQPREYSYGQKSGDFTAFEAIVPKDLVKLNKLYRNIYRYDSVSGAAVDLMAVLPFSEYSISGVNDKAVLNIFLSSCEHLNVQTIMPQLCVEYLTIGKLIGTLVFNGTHGIFTDLIIQDPDFCETTPIPLQGYDPKVDIRVPPEFRKFLASQDPRDKEAKSELPEDLIRSMLSGKVALDPLTTIYVARKTFPKDTGTSYLSRIVPFYLLEQILLEGTIQGAQRRQRAITHIQMGSEEWDPTEAEIDDMIELVLAADMDPVGAVIATKRDVDISEFKSGADFWKVTDEWDGLTQAKMRSLGINESFLTGDATYNTMEAALSVFIEQLRSFRLYMTQKIFYHKIFPALARVHRFIKRKQSELDHGIRITGLAKNPVDIPVKDLIVPDIQWHKQLQPQYDESHLSILSTVQEQGIPIPLRVWAAAGGFSIEKILDGLNEDIDTRTKIADYRKKIKGLGGGEEEGGAEWSVQENNRNDKRRLPGNKLIPTLARACNTADPAQVEKLIAFRDKVIKEPRIKNIDILTGSFK